MSMKKKSITCQVCGWTWTPRVKQPIKCPNPKCQSYNYGLETDKYPEPLEVETD